MNAFKTRPFAVFSIVFYVSACFFAYVTKAALAIVFAVCLPMAVISIILNRRTRVWLLPALVLFAFALSAVFSIFCRESTSLCGNISGQATITKSEIWSEKSDTYLAEICVDEKAVTAALVTEEYLLLGDKIEGTFKISPLPDDMRYYKSEGAIYLAEAEDITVIASGRNGISKAFYKLNNRLSASLTDKLGRDDGGFAASVLLGNRRDLPQSIYSALKSMGVSHLIALSGLHLTVICGLTCAAAYPFGRKAVIFTCIATSVFYVFLTDFSASIVRASVMLIVFSLSFFFRRGSDCATALGFTALAVTLVSPASVFDLGFQLSLSAVAGVRAASQFLKGKWYTERPAYQQMILKLVSPLAVGFGATIFTLPPLILNNSSFTWVGALATVPLALILSLVIWSLVPTLLLPFALPAKISAFLIGIFTRLAAGFSDTGEFLLLCEAKYLGALLCFLCIFAFILSMCLKRKAYKAVSLALSAAMLFGFSMVCVHDVIESRRISKTVVEEINGGDVICVKNKAITVAIDITSGSKYSSDKICDTAYSMGDTELDVLIIADPHAAHFYAAAESSLLYTADVVYLPQGKDSEHLAELLDGYTNVAFYQSGTTLDINGIKISALPTLTCERSTVPSVGFVIDVNSEKTIYLGSSYVELGGNIPDFDKLYLGSYGPKYKENFRVPNKGEIIPSKDSAKYLLP